MSRVIVASYSIMGHYRPVVPIIQQLVEDGHEVLYVSDFPVPAVAELGCQSRTLGVANRPPPSGEEKARVVADPEAILKYQKWIRVELQKTHLEPFRQIVRDFRPEVLAADAQMYSAFIAAHAEHVPWVSVFTTLNPYMHWLDTGITREAKAIAADRAEIFAGYGMDPEFRIWEVVSPFLNLSFVTKELIGDDADVPANTLLAGFSIPPVLKGEGDDVPWDKLKTDRPSVYVSFGSMNFWQPRLIRVIAEAAAPLGVQLVVACGDMVDSEHAKDLPGECLLVRLAPQPQVLEKAAVFVSHAGPASLNEACYYGVPMLAMPITSDQPSVGYLVAKMAKIGITIDPPDVEVANTREALVALLAEPSEYRTRLARVTASYRGSQARKLAGDAIARLAHR